MGATVEIPGIAGSPQSFNAGMTPPTRPPPAKTRRPKSAIVMKQNRKKTLRVVVKWACSVPKRDFESR